MIKHRQRAPHPICAVLLLCALCVAALTAACQSEPPASTEREAPSAGEPQAGGQPAGEAPAGEPQAGGQPAGEAPAGEAPTAQREESAAAPTPAADDLTVLMTHWGPRCEALRQMLVLSCLQRAPESPDGKAICESISAELARIRAAVPSDAPREQRLSYESSCTSLLEGLHTSLRVSEL